MRTKTTLAILAIALLATPLASAGHSVTIANKGDAEPGTYTMIVDVASFQLVDFAGRDAEKGEGHIHYFVNGVDACNAGKADCSAATDYATTAKSFTFTDLEEGDVLEAILVLSDHSNSGTNSEGQLNGGKVADSVTVGSSMGIPGFEAIAVLAALGALILVARRR